MSATILQGDCRDVLASMPADTVDCIVTSPPYFGLRDYGVAGQIGLEATPDEFVAEMVAVFGAARRVLKPEGTLWLNLGDSYNAHPGQRKITDKVGQKQNSNTGSNSAPSRNVASLKAKDLLMIPARVAIALQADGWYLRSDIIWHKPNPMPESVTDRPTSAHEHVFLLAKSERYYFDADAVKETAKDWSAGGPGTGIKATTHYAPHNGGNSGLSSLAGRYKAGNVDQKRNIRNVWTVATQAYTGAHFATFPPALIEPCIKAGCPKGGMVLDPFGGSGTTAVVADRLGRNATIIELNPAYADIARHRIQGDAGMFASFL